MVYGGLNRCLNNRWKVVGASLLIFVASLFLFKPIKKELMPPQDQSMLFVRIQTRWDLPWPLQTIR
jgi:multidrug efflux pump subunit AcrB